MFAGICKQVYKNLLDSPRIRPEAEGCGILRGIVHPDSWLETVLCAGHGGLAHKILLSFFVSDPVLALVHRRSVQDVVQQHSQHLGIVDDIAGELLLFLGRQAAIRKGQKLGESDDRIQRSPHLVAHILHKAGLGSVGQQHPLVGLLELADIIEREEGGNQKDYSQEHGQETGDSGYELLL